MNILEKRKDELTRDNAHSAISGAIRGYEGILSLNDEKQVATYDTPLFQGTLKTTINTAGKLGDLVDHMIGITLSTSYMGHFDARSTVTDLGNAINESDKVLAQYNQASDASKERVLQHLEKEKMQKANNIKQFQECVEELQELYKNGTTQQIADVVEKVNKVASWGTKVPVGKIYQAMDAMLEMANDAGKYEVSGRHLPVIGSLMSSMEGAKPTQRIYVAGFELPFGAKPVAPDADAVYRKGIDFEQIALVLKNNNK